MQSIIKFLTAVIWICIPCFCLQAQKNQKPNIIIILADDPGYGDLRVTVSNDGIIFNKMFYQPGGRYINCPHVTENDGYLFIAFASAKQSVEVIWSKVSDPDKVWMPSEL